MTKTLEICTNGLDPDKPLFPIGPVADMLKKHQRSLRIWHATGLLVPGKSPKGRRLYSWNDIEKAKFIDCLLQEYGLNIAGIKILFSLQPKMLFSARNNIKDESGENYFYKEIKEAAARAGVSADNREKLSRRGRKARAKV